MGLIIFVMVSTAAVVGWLTFKFTRDWCLEKEKLRMAQARLLSHEDLQKNIDRIWEITTPPEGFDIRQAVQEAVEKYWSGIQK
jgi:hypothetical protein